MSEHNTQSRKITVGLVLSWIFGSLFALTGIASVFSEPLQGLVMLIMSAVLIPPVTKLIDYKWKFHLSGGMKIVIIIIGFIMLGSTVDTSNVTTTEQSEKQTSQKGNVVNETTTNEQVNEEQPQADTNEAISTSSEEKAEIPEEKPLPTSSETISQKNAVTKAKSYLDFAGFSHDGLVDQLEYDQFLHDDAVFGVDNSEADWNEQVAKKAKSYMEFSALSRGGLIDQLLYDKFTREQAEYGANSVGL